MKLAFFGAADFSVPTLKLLIDNQFDIGLVVTKPDKPSGRGKKVSPPQIKTLAQEHKLKLSQLQHKSEVLETVKSFGHFDAAIVVAYGLIIPPEVIDYFPLGMINIHGSLLPRWRGPSPIEATILGGDDKTGVTIMKISEKMDAGDIYLSKEVQLNDVVTKPQLYKELSDLGARLLADNLESILEGDIQPKPQDESLATYSHMIKKQDGIIDWDKPATDISREVRAYLGWPGSKASINYNDVIITSVTVHKASGKPGDFSVNSDGELIVYCGEDSLIISSLKPVGRKEISGSEFARGYLKNKG
ncbi:MAG: methionyl-tRNA formyltransferase [Candidatus Saccharimonadales bacterium]